MGLNEKNINLVKIGFQNKCLFIIIDGYRAMKKAGKYSVDWEEENLTAQLIHYTENTPTCKKWKIQIIPEFRIYSEEIIYGKKPSKKAPRIDMRLSSWQEEKKDIYYFEAKNLSENDWIKNNGSKVCSSNQLNRYVNKGIKHFISNHYPPNGCMCGYILNGKSKKSIEKLNVILKKKSINEFQISKPINKHNLIYTVEYNNNKLINIFFDLSKQVHKN